MKSPPCRETKLVRPELFGQAKRLSFDGAARASTAAGGAGVKCYATTPSGGPQGCGLRFTFTPLFPAAR